jgi:hypothetical protein
VRFGSSAFVLTALAVAVAGVVLAFTAPTAARGSMAGIAPTAVDVAEAGDVTCGGLGLPFSSGVLEAADGRVVDAPPPGVAVTVDPGGRTVAWAAAFPLHTIVVGAGGRLHVYAYEPPLTRDARLVAPRDGGGLPDRVDRLLVCWTADGVAVDWCPPTFWAAPTSDPAWSATGVGPGERFSAWFGFEPTRSEVARELGAPLSPTLRQVLDRRGRGRERHVGARMHDAQPAPRGPPRRAEPVLRREAGDVGLVDRDDGDAEADGGAGRRATQHERRGEVHHVRPDGLDGVLDGPGRESDRELPQPRQPHRLHPDDPKPLEHLGPGSGGDDRDAVAAAAQLADDGRDAARDAVYAGGERLGDDEDLHHAAAAPTVTSTSSTGPPGRRRADASQQVPVAITCPRPARTARWWTTQHGWPCTAAPGSGSATRRATP